MWGRFIKAAINGLRIGLCCEYLERCKPHSMGELFDVMQEYCKFDRGRRRKIEAMNLERKTRNNQWSQPKPWHADQPKQSNQKPVNTVTSLSRTISSRRTRRKRQPKGRPWRSEPENTIQGWARSASNQGYDPVSYHLPTLLKAEPGQMPESSTPTPQGNISEASMVNIINAISGGPMSQCMSLRSRGKTTFGQ